jgi:hypothetical protein
LERLKNDPRYMADRDCLWTATIIDGDDLHRVVPFQR